MVVVAGVVTVVTTSVTTTVVGSVVAGSLTGVLTGSSMTPSHSLPPVVSSSMMILGSSVGVSEVSSSAKTGEVVKITAVEPTKIRVKNNLTNLAIIIYYIILCLK